MYVTRDTVMSHLTGISQISWDHTIDSYGKSSSPLNYYVSSWWYPISNRVEFNPQRFWRSCPHWVHQVPSQGQLSVYLLRFLRNIYGNTPDINYCNYRWVKVPWLPCVSIKHFAGPKINTVEKLTELRRAGVNIGSDIHFSGKSLTSWSSLVRMNFSHGSYEYHQSVIDNTRKMVEGVFFVLILHLSLTFL